MRVETLGHLRCPVGGCGGRLAVTGAIGPIWPNTAEEDLIEGVLACATCRTEYPVALGVAILVTGLGEYLYAFWREIDRCSRQLRSHGISQEMRRYLGVASAFTSQAEPYLSENLDWTTSPYIQAHFDPDSQLEDLPEGWWRSALEKFRAAPDPYSYLAGHAASRSDPGGLLVEVGSNVGRMAAQLASGYEYAVGIDWSFNAVLAARQLLVGSPEPMAEYPLELEKGQVEMRRLPQPAGVANLDFVVADGALLPLAGGSAAGLAALNVLCAAPEPGRMFDEFVRVLGTGGLLLVSSPYWSDSEAAGWTPAQMGAALSHGFEVIAQQDMVPWAIRLAKRRWNVYLCHCVAARRAG